jgi:hypothetical protein
MSYFASKRIPIPTNKVGKTFAGTLPRPQLRVPRKRQRQDAWCYAACAQMAIEFCIPEGSVSQCEIAGFVKNTECCTSPIDQDCVASGCSKPQIKQIFTNFGVFSKRKTFSISLSTLKDEIRAGRVIEAVIDWDGVDGQQSSHAVLISGFRGQSIFIVDPLDPPQYFDWFTMTEVENGFNYGNWSDTWIKLERSV